MVGKVTDEWKINEARALTKVYDQDEQYESTLSKQLVRLKVVIDKIKNVIDTEQKSPPYTEQKRILYTLEWLKTKKENIVLRYQWNIERHKFEMDEYHRYSRQQAGMN